MITATAHLSDNIRWIRSETGLSQQGLADAINARTGDGYKRNTVAMWEKGSSFPYIPTLIAIYEMYGERLGFNLHTLIMENLGTGTAMFTTAGNKPFKRVRGLKPGRKVGNTD